MIPQVKQSNQEEQPIYLYVVLLFFIFVLMYVRKGKSSLYRLLFSLRGRVFILFIQNGVLFKYNKGCLQPVLGKKPQAGSKRGRPFDFSCSIQLKYGQIVNENLRKFERFLRKGLEKSEVLDFR